MGQMTYYDAYIGDLDGFNWEVPDGSDINTPKMIGPTFPPLPSRHSSNFVNIIGGRQVDWGAWVLEVTKVELLKILDDWYGDDDWYREGSSMPHLYQNLQEVLRVANSLDEDKKYGLVGTEF